MTFYRSRSGETVEAARFRGGHVDGDYGLSFEAPSQDYSWVADALNAKTLELNVFGSSLILNHRGGSSGIAPGDWVIRRRGGELTHCRGDRFAAEYEAV